MTNIDHLIKMANSIGDFFEALPDRDEALHGIADHIKKFWEPRMRTALLEFLEKQPDGRSNDVALSDIVLQAIKLNKEMLTPSTVAP